MYSIDIDFEVYKQLTSRRATEDVSYNDVIRELLGLSKTAESRVEISVRPSGEDWVTKGVRFPAGTAFRALHKHRVHSGWVEAGALIVNGERFRSPSAAAMAVTGGAVNGWRFWECRRPGDTVWRSIDSLRKREDL